MHDDGVQSFPFSAEILTGRSFRDFRDTDVQKIVGTVTGWVIARKPGQGHGCWRSEDTHVLWAEPSNKLECAGHAEPKKVVE